MVRLKDEKSVMFLISAATAFHSHGPAIEKAMSPNFVLVRGMSYSVVIAEQSRRCPGNDEIGVVVFIRYKGHGNVVERCDQDDHVVRTFGSEYQHSEMSRSDPTQLRLEM